jgi:hypothetical protein
MSNGCSGEQARSFFKGGKDLDSVLKHVRDTGCDACREILSEAAVVFAHAALLPEGTTVEVGSPSRRQQWVRALLRWVLLPFSTFAAGASVEACKQARKEVSTLGAPKGRVDRVGVEIDRRGIDRIWPA